MYKKRRLINPEGVDQPRIWYGGAGRLEGYTYVDFSAIKEGGFIEVKNRLLVNKIACGDIPRVIFATL